MKMRIAVAQQNGNPGQPEENREKAIGFLLPALDLGTDMILFHEEMLVGYTNISSVGRDRGWANYRSISTPSAWKRIAEYLWADRA